MKQALLAVSVFLAGTTAFGQNINDHKISFTYIQLPLQKIDSQYDNYSVSVEHAYEQANEDSTNLFEIRQQAALAFFNTQIEIYQNQRDSLDRIHLTNLATWEKQVNAGVTNPDGTQLPRPNPPIYPAPPAYPRTEQPVLHSEYLNENVTQRINLAGYEVGTGEVEITITLNPIRNIRIVSGKKGTGAATKYTYSARYILPIGVKVTSPTQGILMETTLFDNEQSYNMRDYDSQFEYELYMKDNREVFFRELETYARSQALSMTNDYINNQFGFVERNRVAEIYSVKSYKGYDYTDVTNAFTKITFALQEVSNSRDRSTAQAKIQDAINATIGILEESNLSDNKSRINDKITAMLQCNLAELYVWQGEFDKCEATMNIASNSGEGKARRHLDDEKGFYADQRKRWEVHY